MDLLKCFAIFSVLVGHSTEQLSGGLFWDHPVWEFIYTYHMPLFMFVSGFFFLSSLRRGYGEMARRKLLQLGVPSLTAYAIACTIMLAAGVTAIADLCELSFNGFMNCVWFLKCLLFCYLLMHPICRWVQKDWVAAIAATVLVILIPGTEIVNLNFMLPMFCLGMICGNRQEEIERHRRLWLAASIILFGVLLCFWSGHLTVYERPTRFWTAASAAAVGGTGSAGTLSPDWNNLGLTIYRLALGMSGSMVCYLLSKPVYEAIRGWRWQPSVSTSSRPSCWKFWSTAFRSMCRFRTPTGSHPFWPSPNWSYATTWSSCSARPACSGCWSSAKSSRQSFTI